MKARRFTRSAVLAALASAATLAFAPAAHAARNAEAESYVQQHASAALAALGDPALTGPQKQQTFYRLVQQFSDMPRIALNVGELLHQAIKGLLLYRLVQQFSDMPRIALWVLGRHGAQLRADAALRQQWTSTFQDFAIAVYEYRMNRYSGSALRVVGSNELTPNQVVDVTTEVTPRGQTQTTIVRWRLNRSGQGWKVFDLQVRAQNGDTIWLGQLQQQDFLAELGSNGGDIRSLMSQIQTQTNAMRQRVAARG